jgi:COP9 signalosome complex subunit 8
MVNAPPTPPPLSTTELQDAARASSSQISTETQPNAPDVYQLRFPAIVGAASRSDYRAVARIAEEIDLTVRQPLNVTGQECNNSLKLQAAGDHQTSRLLIIAPLVLAYLIEDQT